MWVRLAVNKQIPDENGRPQTRYPGEWVEIGKQIALAWLAIGDAERPDLPDMKYFINCGIVVSDDMQKAKSILPGIEVSQGEPALIYEKTLLWNTSKNFRPEFIADGFHLLDTWHIVCPIVSYEKLARDFGSDDDRQQTEKLIHDLRVPVYSPDVIFMRRCRETRDLLDKWQQGNGDKTLALLRAIYEVKPLILALPTIWLN